MEAIICYIILEICYSKVASEPFKGSKKNVLRVLGFCIINSSLSNFSLAQGDYLNDPYNASELWEVTFNKSEVALHSDKFCTNEVSFCADCFRDQFLVTDFQKAHGEVFSVQIEFDRRKREYFWVKMNDLLLTKHCMKNKEVPLKIILSTDWGETIRPIPLYDQPLNGEILDKIHGEIYFVYDVYPNEYRFSPQDASSYLVGTSVTYESHYSNENNAENTLIGWISNLKSNPLALWSSNLAVQPNLSPYAKTSKLETEKFAFVLSSSFDAIQYSISGHIDSSAISDYELVKANYEFTNEEGRMPFLHRVENNSERSNVYKVAYRCELFEIPTRNKKSYYEPPIPYTTGYISNELEGLSSPPFEFILLLSNNDLSFLSSYYNKIIQYLAKIMKDERYDGLKSLRRLEIELNNWENYKQIPKPEKRNLFLTRFLAKNKLHSSVEIKKIRSIVYQKKVLIDQLIIQIHDGKGQLIGRNRYLWIGINQIF